MVRIPPNLIYLTIYNPTLRPSSPISGDDEDAEEQAHILFYTAKERAVSRDRMLRQVGLAKALVNFSDVFNAEGPCSNVHSQSRRMVMVSPEPNFWIHAGIELAKTQRSPIDKGKAKGKEKETSKFSDKAKVDKQPIMYDYHDASVHDVALRSDILRGYEQFKLIHGSFTSILSTLGQQALELQLERFFTIWAWSWNLEGGHQFGEHLGVPLHPLYRSLVPIIDRFSIQVHDPIAPFIILPPFIIPSTRFKEACYPPSLSWHLLSMFPRLHESMPADQVADPPIAAEDAVKTNQPSESNTSDSEAGFVKGNGMSAPNTNTFLGIPAMNINMNVDVRKWSWPGYLTFKKGSGKRATEAFMSEGQAEKVSDDQTKIGNEQPLHMHIDTNALEDAISSDTRSVSVQDDLDNKVLDTAELQDILSQSERTIVPSDSDKHPVSDSRLDGSISPDGNIQRAQTPTLPLENLRSSRMRGPADSDAASLSTETSGQDELFHPEPSPQLSVINIHLADANDPLATQPRKVFYLTKYPIAAVLMGLDGGSENTNPDASELCSVAEKVVRLLDDIENAMADDALKSASDTLPSATNILQPKDNHIICATPFTLSSPGSMSNSEHLFNAQQLQENDPGISEVFSRGQNPQHWHIAKRGLGVSEGGTVVNGEVYMEVLRKETSLTDVDNLVAGVVRRCGLVD